MPLYIPSYKYPLLYSPACHHRGRWPPPVLTTAPRRSSYPHVQVHHTPAIGISPPVNRHRERGHQQDRSRSRSYGPRRRYVRFTDQPVVIDLPASPPRNPSPAPAPTRGRFSCTSRTPAAPFPTSSHPAATARQVSMSPSPARSRPRHSGTRAAAATFGLHDLLTSFPPGLWDLQRNARPPYHPKHEPHYSEPAFSAKHRKRSLTLHFRPCGRADLAWSAMVKAASCAKHLNFGDVLKAISTELLGRSVCRDVREGDLCYAGARKAQRVRTRRGHTSRAHWDGELRNVDLYHTAHGKKLMFEGLRPQKTDDGEVGYLVTFGCA